MGSGTGLFAAVAALALVLQSHAIMSGREAAPRSHPYMASIQKPTEGGSFQHECGGFLISDQWLMTAAHCFETGSAGRRVILGAHSVSAAEDSKQTFGILSLHKHPRFNSDNYDNDIALIKLDRKAVQSDAVKPVRFQRAGGTDPGTGAQVHTAGWGYLSNLEDSPEKLQELDIPVIRREQCVKSSHYGSRFTENMLCAAGAGKDTCRGDSGGPLLYGGVAVGVTSNGGRKCGTSRKPGLYTYISHYTPWIDTTMTL